MKRILALSLAALLLVGSLAGCGGTPAGSNSDTKVLRVGMECGYAPFNWTQMDDSNGAVKLSDGTFAGGYDVEIAKRVASEMGYTLELFKVEWDGLAPSLTSNQIDAVIAGMTDTADRRLTIDFTDRYYTSDLVLVVRADGAYATATSLADFSGAKVTGQLATLHYDVVEQIPGVDKQDGMADFPTMVAALNSGRIDAYVSERPGAMSAQISNPGLTYITFDEATGFDYETGDVSVSIGIRQNEEEFKTLLNEALAAITDSERQEYMENALINQPLAQ